MAVLRILGMLLVFLVLFYLSLLVSSRPLTDSERHSVDRAIAILDERGFHDDAWMLRNVATFRGPDNWLNTVTPDDAFAKTNFPFQVISIYSDFWLLPTDDVERAAVLLHEARHLRGESEAAAYRYVWENRCQLGWSADNGYDEHPTYKGVVTEATEFNPGMIANEELMGPCPQ